MGPGTIVVEVHTTTENPYYRGDRLWTKEWVQANVDQELLDTLRADPHIQVRDLDPGEQARRRVGLATADYEVAKAAKDKADKEHDRALRVLEEAKASGTDAGPAPTAARNPTPVTDVLRQYGRQAPEASPVAPTTPQALPESIATQPAVPHSESLHEPHDGPARHPSNVPPSRLRR